MRSACSELHGGNDWAGKHHTAGSWKHPLYSVKSISAAPWAPAKAIIIIYVSERAQGFRRGNRPRIKLVQSVKCCSGCWFAGVIVAADHCSNQFTLVSQWWGKKFTICQVPLTKSLNQNNTCTCCLFKDENRTSMCTLWIVQVLHCPDTKVPHFFVPSASH